MRLIGSAFEIAIAALAVLLISTFLSYAWPDKDYGLSGWVQAIGSIAAIVYAVRIANADRAFQTAEKTVFAVLQGQLIKPQLEEFTYTARYHSEELISPHIFNPTIASPLLDWISNQPMWTIDEISLLAGLKDGVAVDFAKGQAAIKAAIVELHYVRSASPPRNEVEDAAANRARRAKRATALYWEGLGLLETVKSRIPDTLSDLPIR